MALFRGTEWVSMGFSHGAGGLVRGVAEMPSQDSQQSFAHAWDNSWAGLACSPHPSQKGTGHRKTLDWHPNGCAHAAGADLSWALPCFQQRSRKRARLSAPHRFNPCYHGDTEAKVAERRVTGWVPSWARGGNVKLWELDLGSMRTGKEGETERSSKRRRDYRHVRNSRYKGLQMQKTLQSCREEKRWRETITCLLKAPQPPVHIRALPCELPLHNPR